jgi:hypothetical protein
MSEINVALFGGVRHGRDTRVPLTGSVGNAFRRPHRYGLSTSLTLEEPFVRVDAGGEVYDRTRR